MSTSDGSKTEEKTERRQVVWILEHNFIRFQRNENNFELESTCMISFQQKSKKKINFKYRREENKV